MQAFVMRAHGDLSHLERREVAMPAVTHAGDVRVQLKAAALNHLDLWTLRGLPGLSLTFPHILGGDGAGVVEAIGTEVTRVSPGDPVMINPGISCYHCAYCLRGDHALCETYGLLGEHLPGTLAEFVVVPEQNLERIPRRADGEPVVSWSEAAAFSLVSLTAWRMLVSRAQVKAGETVLIWGVGGGVSLMALQIAKRSGARVVVTSSSDAKLDRAREFGADVTINHRTEDVVKEFRRQTGMRGAEVVVDSVGDATWRQSLRLLLPAGRLVTCGATSGAKVEIDLRRLFWYQWSILGSTMGGAEDYREVVRLLAQEQLRPVVDSVVPLDRAAEAFERLSRGEQFGKLVVALEA
jgi:NADPH:quinone reductase-like Zn-dependent oxidoreductase